MLTLRHPATARATTTTTTAMMANKPQEQQHVGCQKIKSIKRIWLLPSQGAIYSQLGQGWVFFWPKSANRCYFRRTTDRRIRGEYVMQEQ